MNNPEMHQRGSFATKFGVIAAIAGSAIGLGNIWKFPYETGQNGGAAFILVYLLLMLVIGVPVMISEFIIGRQSRKNPVGAFKALKPKSKWKYVGVLGIAASFLILAFYSAIGGWTLEYIRLSVINQFDGMNAQDLHTLYANFVSNPGFPILWQSLFMILTVVIVMLGVEKGIERYTKYLMPLLFVLLVVLCIRSVTLPNASKGLSFLFNPDFTKIDQKVVINALGQVFFSLSLGMGTLITYGSYIRKEVNLTTTAIKVSFVDTLVAILAGIAIFPAVFSLGFNPAEGTGLVFIVLPQVFYSMPFGQILAILFFILLTIASITSSISLLEVVVAYLIEERHLKRKKATIIAGAATMIMAVLCSLSFANNSVFRTDSGTLFDFVVYLTNNIMLPLGGLCIVIFLGWRLNKNIIYKQLGAEKQSFWIRLFMFIIKFVAPIAIILVFLSAINIL